MVSQRAVGLGVLPVPVLEVHRGSGIEPWHSALVVPHLLSEGAQAQAIARERNEINAERALYEASHAMAKWRMHIRGYVPLLASYAQSPIGRGYLFGLGCSSTPSIPARQLAMQKRAHASGGYKKS